VFENEKVPVLALAVMDLEPLIVRLRETCDEEGKEHVAAKACVKHAGQVWACSQCKTIFPVLCCVDSLAPLPACQTIIIGYFSLTLVNQIMCMLFAVVACLR